MHDEYKIQVAHMAKEITLAFAGKLKYTDVSSDAAMNDNLSKIITSFYSEVYETIINKVEKK